MDLELLKTLYFRELDRRAQLDGAPTPRIAILGIVGGVFTYYSEKLELSQPLATWYFLICAAGAIAFSALAIVWIIRSYVGYTWLSLPHADELAAHYRSLVEYHEDVATEIAEPDRVFANHLRQLLVTAMARNTRNNNRRSELVYGASVFLSVAVVFALLAGLPLLSDALAAVLKV